jgi:hypothetical protein
MSKNSYIFRYGFLAKVRRETKLQSSSVGSLGAAFRSIFSTLQNRVAPSILGRLERFII